MYAFTIPSMRCGGCAGRVQRAVIEADADAQVRVDVANRQVQVESALDAERLLAALAAAGYPAEG